MKANKDVLNKSDWSEYGTCKGKQNLMLTF